MNQSFVISDTSFIVNWKLCLHSRCLIGASDLYKLTIVDSPGKVWFIVRQGGGGGGGREMQKIISISLLLLLSFLLPLLTPPVKIPFSPLVSTAVKIKDGGYTFHKENTEPQLTKIAPAPQAVC